MVPHANELHEEFSARGLQIIGVTGEEKSKTEPWIEDKGVEYGYAYDPNNKLKGALGIRGIPHGVLVDPLGQIVWRGHPATLTGEIIEQALRSNSLPQPLWAWPEVLEPVKEALATERYNRALALVTKLELELEPYKSRLPALIEARIEQRLTELAGLLADRDVLGFETRFAGLDVGLEGLPAAARLAELIKPLTEDPVLGEAKSAQVRMAAARETIARHTSGDQPLTLERIQALNEELAPISKRFGDLAPGREAKELGKALKALKKQLAK